MKMQNILISIFCALFILVSCKKDDDISEVLPELFIDSLRIVQSNIPAGLYTDLYFVDDKTGYAVSNFGAIIRTCDCGYTWEELESPAEFFLVKVQFTDKQTGYIIGGGISGGYFLKTTDGGDTWQVTDLHTPENESPSGMYFLNNSKGFISGEKLFIRTTDGGKIWTEVLNPAPGNINDVSFIDENEGYAVSDDGNYFKSSDGGDSWQSFQSATSQNLKKIYFIESKPYAKCANNLFVDLDTGEEAFTVPDCAFEFLFLDLKRSVGIGQHYEGGFLPYGDIFLTNDGWESYVQKKYQPQSEAMNVTALFKPREGEIIIIGCGTVNSSVILLRY